MSVPAIRITAPATVPAVVRPRKGITVALLLSLGLHAIVILGLIEWFEDAPECPAADAFGFACGPAPLVDHETIVPDRWRSPDTFVPWKSPSIVRATLAAANAPPAIPAPLPHAAEPPVEGPVPTSRSDTNVVGRNPAAEKPQRPPTDPAASLDGSASERNLDYAAALRQIADLDARQAGVPPRVRRIVEERTETSEDAWYLESWRRKVQRIGELNYPAKARAQKIYGNLRLLVAIEPDGALREVRVIDSSGHRVLDDAAVRIVRLAAPYAPFPPAMREDTDVLEIVRTWQFKKRGSTSRS